MNNGTTEIVMGVEDLCDYLRIGRSTGYKLLQSGEIKACRIGKNWRIPLSAINDYLSKACKIKIS